MDQATYERLISECIEALQQANTVLNKNIQEIQKGASDVQKKQELLEKWDPEHLRLNKGLLIDFDNIVPSNLTEQIRDSIEKLRKLKADLFQHTNVIEGRFKELAPRKRNEIDNLLESNGE